MTVKLQRKQIINTLDNRGWTQGSFGNDGHGPVCLHGAIRLCQPEDATLIEQVWQKRGYGTEWNDDKSTTEQMVRQYVLDADPITDQELAEVFGPQWEHIVRLVRRASRVTVDEVEALAAARAAARTAAGATAWDAAWAASGAAAGAAARAAARTAAGAAAWAAARDATRAAAWDATLALSVRDLIGPKFTQEAYALLTGPWVSVIGPVHPDDKEVE